MIHFNYENGVIPNISGEFKFYTSPVVYDPLDFTPRQIIMFAWSPELKQDLHLWSRPDNSDEERDMIINKLVDDFKKALKENTIKKIDYKDGKLQMPTISEW